MTEAGSVLPEASEWNAAVEHSKAHPTHILGPYEGAYGALHMYCDGSGELADRTGSHIKGSSWMEFAVRSTIARRPTRPEAKEAETAAIKAEHPIFNKQHNDTPEARKRAVEYLIKHNRLDLLAIAVSRG